MSEELEERGYEDVSGAALANAILHFGMPQTPDAAGDLLTKWRTLLAQPPPRRKLPVKP
jgi:hypothetical protein